MFGYEKRCPSCNYELPHRALWRFTTWWGRRKAAPCPFCDAVLRWSPSWYWVSVWAILGAVGWFWLWWQGQSPAMLMIIFAAMFGEWMVMWSIELEQIGPSEQEIFE